MKVLVVDDHAVVRSGVKRVLHGLPDVDEVLEAGDAAGALHAVKAGGVGAVVLDLSLPDRNGLSVIAEMRAASPPPTILVLTMHPERAYAMRAMKAGASGYVTKGAPRRELEQALRAVLQGGRYVSQSLAEVLVAQLQGGVQAPHERLSDREYQVAHALASGSTVTEIAERLHLSSKTVSTHRARALAKLGLNSNVELVRYALEHGLIE